MSAAIKVENVAKSYRIGKGLETVVLRDVSFRIEPGERVALHGPSGSGKSTLLNLLGAMDKPSAGKVVVADRDLTVLNDNQRAKYRSEIVGMVFQSFNLMPHLTAKQNVLMPAILAGRPQVEAEKRASILLERVGLSHRAAHRPTELSGGEQQRVAIVRALINRPSLVLADEPTGNLDQKTGAEIIQLLKELTSSESGTLMIVTHDPSIAAAMQRQLSLVDGVLAEKA